MDSIDKKASTNMLKTSIPFVVSAFMQSMSNTLSLHFIGKTNSTHQLASVGLSLMISNMLFISVLIGLTTGMDTLCTQARGRGDNSMVGKYAN